MENIEAIKEQITSAEADAKEWRSKRVKLSIELSKLKQQAAHKGVKADTGSLDEELKKAHEAEKVLTDSVTDLVGILQELSVEEEGTAKGSEAPPQSNERVSDAGFELGGPVRMGRVPTTLPQYVPESMDSGII